MWNRTPLALYPGEQGYPCVEIDGTSILGNVNSVILAFGIIGTSNKQACIFLVMNE